MADYIGTAGDDRHTGTDFVDLINGLGGDDVLLGGAASDVIRGGDGADMLVGEAGNDQLLGESGDDLLVGGIGNDVLTGGDGADVLDGGKGVDRMTGGLGDDVYIVDHARDRVIEAGRGGHDTVNTSVDFVVFGSVEVVNLIGDATTVHGGRFGNTINGSGLRNALYGEGGDDVLNGGGAADVLDGGHGADRLIGGEGTDTLTGGAGADRFIVTFGTDAWDDHITDFTREDRIDLSAIDADVTTAGNDAFTLIGETAFTGVAGQLRTAAGAGWNGGTMVYGDLNGDRIEDFGFEVSSAGLPLAAGDFLL